MFEVTLLQTIFLAVFIVVTFAVLIDFWEKWKTFKYIPGPPGRPLPLVGHTLKFQKKKEDFFSDLCSRLQEDIIDKGHEIGCVFLGPTPVILVVGPNAAEVLLRSSRHITKSFIYTFLHEWLGTGLLTSTGEKWAARRKLLTPAFHFDILENFLDVMNEQASVFTRKLKCSAKDGKRIDIFKSVTLCALDIICETAMGTQISAQDDSDSEYVTAVYNISEYLWARITSPWIWWGPLYSITPQGRAYYKALDILHSFTKKVIRDRIEEFNKKEPVTKKTRLAFLDLLLQSSGGGKVLNFKDIQEEVDTFMFEGHDTTAAGMSWAIFLISSHRNVQYKIQQELDQVLGPDLDKKITKDDLKKLEYLDIVVKECLRHLPSVPLIGRTTSCDCTIDGHNIPAGTQCLIFPPLINNLEKYWPNPKKFDPERFTSDMIADQHPYAYIPFSAGPRNCIGQRFASMEEKVVLAHLFRRYSVTACDKREDLKILGDVILRPGSGVNVTLTQRKPFE